MTSEVQGNAPKTFGLSLETRVKLEEFYSERRTLGEEIKETLAEVRSLREEFERPQRLIDKIVDGTVGTVVSIGGEALDAVIDTTRTCACKVLRLQKIENSEKEAAKPSK